MNDLDRLFREYHGPLVRYLTRRLGDRDWAEEVTQETFLRAARQETIVSERAWLFAVATNLVRDEARKDARRRRHLELLREQAKADEIVEPEPLTLERAEEAAMARRALEMLTRYSWPGNVRELANVVERAVLLCDEAVVHGHHLSPAIHAAEGGAPAAFSLAESLDAYEKDLLLDALRATRGVRSRAARLLQTTDRIFNYKVRKHAIDCRRFKS